MGRALSLMVLVSACAGMRPAEPVPSWKARTNAAWTAITDDGKQVPPLDRPFVQTGMSSADAIVFVAMKGDGAPPRVQGVEALPGRILADGAYRVTEREIAGAVRIEIAGLTPSTRYRVTFAAGKEVQTAESRTAPEAAEAASVLIASCNEPWNQATRDGNTVGVAAASASSLRSLDLRARGFLPVELTGAVRHVSERPSFLIGLGDQAYVDAEPDEEGSLALFGGARSNQLRVAATELWPEVLERIYRMHFLIPSLHRAMANLPTAMVWDDHEIRDGWGSQRDEGELIPATSQPWAQYFSEARKMTWQFEVAGNPNAGGAPVMGFDAALTRELDTSFTWSDRLRVFLLDTRTLRGRPEGVILSDAQLGRVEAWFAACGAAPSVFLLGVPVPISVNHDNAISAAGATLESELDDDVNDGWWATPGAQAMRQKLETLIAGHADRCPDDRIVLASGDVHESGLVAIAREKKVIAYEVISSGIASMAFDGALSRALLGARTEYFAKSPTGLTYSGVGRISTGSSFAELFFDFPDNAPPVLRVLYYPTTALDAFTDTTLTNVGETLKGTTWTTGTTGVAQLAQGASLLKTAAAIGLDYGVAAPKSGDYALVESSTRCTTSTGPVSNGTNIDALVSDWSTVLKVAPTCYRK